MTLEFLTSNYGNDIFQSINSDITLWNENAQGKTGKIFKGITSFSAHLLTATFVGPTLIIYDIAMALLTGSASLVTSKSYSSTQHHFNSAKKIALSIAISLLSTFHLYPTSQPQIELRIPELAKRDVAEHSRVKSPQPAYKSPVISSFFKINPLMPQLKELEKTNKPLSSFEKYEETHLYPVSQVQKDPFALQKIRDQEFMAKCTREFGLTYNESCSFLRDSTNQ